MKTCGEPTVRAFTVIANIIVRIGTIRIVSKSQNAVTQGVEEPESNLLIVAGLLLGKAESGEHQCGNDGEVLHHGWVI